MEAIVQAQIEEMQRDERVILMGEDIAVYGDGKVLKTFGAKRIWSTPISENSFTRHGDGRGDDRAAPDRGALDIASFMYLASDQIINQAGKLRYMTGGQMKVPVVFRCSHVLQRVHRRAAFRPAVSDVHECAGTEDHRAHDARRHEGTAEVRHPR